MMRVICTGLAALLMASSALAQRTAVTPEQDMKARQAFTKESASATYRERWNLSDLPAYVPRPGLSGVIRIEGNDAEIPLVAKLQAAFVQVQPGVELKPHLVTTEQGIPGLYERTADLALLGRQIEWDEMLAYERTFHHDPIEVTMATGAYALPGPVTWGIGIFVNAKNPIERMTVQQLAGIFGGTRTGGWRGTQWDPGLARPGSADLRQWGQLGLGGVWAKRPIDVDIYALKYHFTGAFDRAVFGGGDVWNDHAKQFANYVGEDGKLHMAGTGLIDAVAADPGGITYTGMIFARPGVKALAISAGPGKAYVPLTIETLRNRTYPLLRDIYLYVNGSDGKPNDAAAAAFAAFIVSREGQQIIMDDAHYLPLTAEASRAQLSKLRR